jgi:hypothetical protein
LRLGCCSDEETYCELVGYDRVLQSGRWPSELLMSIRHLCSGWYLAKERKPLIIEKRGKSGLQDRSTDWTELMSILMALENVGSKTGQNHQELNPKVPYSIIQQLFVHPSNNTKFFLILSYSLLCLKFSSLILRFSQTDV